MLTNRYLPQRYARISPRSGYAPIFDNVRQMCINRCALMRRAASGIVLNVLPSKVRILLNCVRWDKERLMEKLYSDDQEAMFEEAQVKGVQGEVQW